MGGAEEAPLSGSCCEERGRDQSRGSHSSAPCPAAILYVMAKPAFACHSHVVGSAIFPRGKTRVLGTSCRLRGPRGSVSQGPSVSDCFLLPIDEFALTSRPPATLSLCSPFSVPPWSLLGSQNRKPGRAEFIGPSPLCCSQGC